MKQLFASLFIFCMMASTTFAQNNTYNMQITLANGTTVSIGANEVKNISFENGLVSMDGQKLDDIVKSLSAQNTIIEELKSNVNEVYSGLLTLQAGVDKNIASVQDNLSVLKVSIEKIQAGLATQTDPEELDAAIKAIVDPLSTKLASTDASINSISAEMKAVNEALNALKSAMSSYATVEQLNEAIKSIEAGQGTPSDSNSDIDEVKASIMDLKEAIEALRKEYSSSLSDYVSKTSMTEALKAYPTAAELNTAYEEVMANYKNGFISEFC